MDLKISEGRSFLAQAVLMSQYLDMAGKWNRHYAMQMEAKKRLELALMFWDYGTTLYSETQSLMPMPSHLENFKPNIFPHEDSDTHKALSQNCYKYPHGSYLRLHHHLQATRDSVDGVRCRDPLQLVPNVAMLYEHTPSASRNGAGFKFRRREGGVEMSRRWTDENAHFGRVLLLYALVCLDVPDMTQFHRAEKLAPAQSFQHPHHAGTPGH
ncbi:uncharacterized protein VTP21DRAFT_6738 [Calcarisporiella thermophila]|uniref:uncharacterized protein n=1 Tax=Calcarisporiella thermophila TaxID=911321 RepID=UPI003742E967